MSRPFTNPLAKSLYSSPQQVTPPILSPSPQQPKRTASPSTPTSKYPSPLPKTPVTVDQTPTGKWSHPAVSQVTLLEAKKAPNDTTIRRILYNLGALFVLYKATPYVQIGVASQSAEVIKYTNWTIYTFCILLSYNIIENARRFWWTNTYDDPTLTARQRDLLNLPASPASSQAKARAAAITPPKYQKSYTPSPATQSPLSGRRSFSGVTTPTYTGIGTNTASPLVRSSPHLLGSPTTRSVSLSNASASQLTHSSSELQGSPRWRYSQSIAK